MRTFLRRTMVAATALAALAAADAATTPMAQASQPYWTVVEPDHTDLYVDWFAVDSVASDPSMVSPACQDMGPFEYGGCMDWVTICTRAANTDYHGHAVRIGFYASQGTCSVLNLG